MLLPVTERSDVERTGGCIAASPTPPCSGVLKAPIASLLLPRVRAGEVEPAGVRCAVAVAVAGVRVGCSPALALVGAGGTAAAADCFGGGRGAEDIARDGAAHSKATALQLHTTNSNVFSKKMSQKNKPRTAKSRLVDGTPPIHRSHLI